MVSDEVSRERALRGFHKSSMGWALTAAMFYDGYIPLLSPMEAMHNSAFTMLGSTQTQSSSAIGE